MSPAWLAPGCAGFSSGAPMADLAAHAEVVKLARELDADPDQLRPLQRLEVAELRTLRRAVARRLLGSQRAAFQRAAAATKLLPAAVSGRLAEQLIPPLLAARIAAELPVSRAIRLADQLSVDYLADVCLAIDPQHVVGIVGSMPEDDIIEVAHVLLARQEYVTLGRFVEVASQRVIQAVIDKADDAALLDMAVAIESPGRLEAVLSLLDEQRLTSVIRTAASSDRILEALTLTVPAGREGRARLGRVIAALELHLLTDLIEITRREDVWDQVVPLLLEMPEQDMVRLLRSSLLDDPEVVRGLRASIERLEIPRQRLESLPVEVRVQLGLDGA